ncbi:hypothetical protein LIER_35644 [Lithospermum erythrorhizon]|uniref:Envelope-like protein n=1 Tax=Lithospermum erythrorhizon TaxID=34254 RepID=A0AAV3NVF8_LITER
MKNKTYIVIIEESGMLAITGDIGPHWPSIVRQFICNLSEDIANPSSPMLHKVKLRRLMFNFSHMLINRYYGRQNEGISRSSLKVDDIIKTLTEGALTEWPPKGQLQASVLSLRILYVMGSQQDLDFGRVIFDQIVDHSRTGAKMKPIEFPSLICSILIHQHPEVLKAGDGLGEDAKPLTITYKLMAGKHVVDV